VTQTPARPIEVGQPPGLLGRLYGAAHVLLVITALCWAGNFVIGRWSAGHVPPIFLSWSRWTLAMCLLAPFALDHVRRDWPAIRANWAALLLLGVTGGGMFNSLQYLALNHTSALNALLINSGGPAFVALACLAIFGDRIGLRQWAGIALSFLGVLIVGAKGDLLAFGSISFVPGDLFMLAAMVTWGVYTACLRKRPAIHFLSFTLVLMFIASLVNAPAVLWERSTGLVAHADLTTLAVVGYCAVFPSLVSYICYNRGVQLIGGARAGAYIHLVTLLGAMLSILLLGEEMRFYHIAGFVLILAGVVLAARASGQR
jgi:drug/metabolite transporter (DMT)-like permease